MVFLCSQARRLAEKNRSEEESMRLALGLPQEKDTATASSAHNAVGDARDQASVNLQKTSELNDATDQMKLQAGSSLGESESDCFVSRGVRTQKTHRF